ncbi:MAG: protein kinase domain-containing protein, partial [Tepidisphaeraceae bacterium]
MSERNDDSASDEQMPPGQPYASAQFSNVVSAVRELKHPTQIGPYHILQLIGEGGMGSVYQAEQREPIHRTVAIKVIKLGMDTRQFVARFESERQALALMNHPNVARVLDAGATETGRPYFVMEYVPGEPITHFADRHKHTVRQRLELFTQACDAVQHAHQKAIIHRDLKPSNILVTLQDGRPWVKVIDFGVAKAVSHRLTEKTLFTEAGQLMGTPEYMSPEQAEASLLDVDTRSDVYSLGVVLYELLSGALPFDASSLRSPGSGEIQRIIRDVEPPRPSTRLSGLGKGAREIARLRQTPLESLHRQLKHELDWIPLKAMRKDRAQRYATATELSEDIQNYLSNRPLRAGPESAAYRVRKFIRRNQAGVVAAAAMVLLLIGGVIATSWQAYRATKAERVALKEKREADLQRQAALSASENVSEVNRFLAEDLLGSAAPEVTRGKEMTVREAIDRAADTIPTRFKNRPLTEGAVREALAETYGALGERSRALPHIQAARDIYLRAYGADHRFSISATITLGRVLAELNRHDEAEPLIRQSLERAERLFGSEHEVTLAAVGALAMTLRMQERLVEAEPLYRRVLEANRRRYDSRHEEVAKSLNNLAVLLNTDHRAAEAEPLYRESIEIRSALLGEDHPAYLGTLSNLAVVLEDQGKRDEAEQLLRKVLSGMRRVLKDDHPST